jgi:hypothetical protein
VPLTSAMQLNIEILHHRMNIIRAEWGKPMRVTSGVRSIADHRRIYANKKVVRIPMGSKHLTAQACDIEDKDGALMAWCKTNVPLLERVGLWLEADTKGWCHFQTVPPGSGNRFFKP